MRFALLFLDVHARKHREENHQPEDHVGPEIGDAHDHESVLRCWVFDEKSSQKTLRSKTYGMLSIQPWQPRSGTIDTVLKCCAKVIFPSPLKGLYPKNTSSVQHFSDIMVRGMGAVSDQTVASLYRVSFRSDEIQVTPREGEILRSLALRVRELSELPEQEEKRELWYRHNALEKTRPVIFCDPENGWNEIIPPSSLSCEGRLARHWEMFLRKEIFWGESMGDDKVIEPYFDVPYIYSLKPNPADLAVPQVDEAYLRKKLREALDITRGCRVEIIMKDNHTIGGNPENVITWCRIAKEEAERI